MQRPDPSTSTSQSDPPLRPHTDRAPGYKWLVVLMLWFICFFNYADRQAIFAVFPVLREQFGFNNEQLGLIGSAFMWVYAAGAPFAGLVCDRFRRKSLILGGCFFWSLVTILTGSCSKLWHFVTVRALEGFGETFYFPASMSLVSDYHSPQTRSRAMSLHQSSVYVGTILGSWFGAWMAMRWGWATGFYVFGGLGMLLSVALLGLLAEPQRGAAESLISPPERSPANHASETASFQETLGDIFRAPLAILLMLVFVAANFVATIFLTWTPTFLVDKFQYDLATAGLNGTIFIHLASALTVPLMGYVADRAALRWPRGRIIPQAAGLLLGSIFVAWVGMANSRFTLIIAMTLFGICKGAYDSGIFASLFDVIPARSRGTAAGLMNTVGWGGGALGPYFTGWFSEHGPYASQIDNMSAAITSCSALYLASGIVLAIVCWRTVAGQRNGNAGDKLA